MAQMIKEYRAAPDADRWDRITKQELLDLIAERKDGARRTTDDIAIRSFNETIEEAEQALQEVENGSTAWAAQDEDGWYFAVGTDRFDDDQCKVVDAQVEAQSEWADAHPGFDTPADENTDEFIGAELDSANLRRGIAKFDSLASVDDFKRAVVRGMNRWAESFVSAE